MDGDENSLAALSDRDVFPHCGQVVVEIPATLLPVNAGRRLAHGAILTDFPAVTWTSSFSSEVPEVRSRITFFSVAFRFVASDDRSLTNRLGEVPASLSSSCSKSRSWEARFGPVMIKADGILSSLRGD